MLIHCCFCDVCDPMAVQLFAAAQRTYKLSAGFGRHVPVPISLRVHNGHASIIAPSVAARSRGVDEFAGLLLRNLVAHGLGNLFSAFTHARTAVAQQYMMLQMIQIINSQSVHPLILKIVCISTPEPLLRAFPAILLKNIT